MITKQFSFFPQLFLTAILIIISEQTQAGGLFYPEIGTIALGRGGAFVARADDLSAFYHNPAGLSKSKGFNVHLGGNLNDLNVTFRRGGAAEEGVGLNGEWFPLDDRYILDEYDPPVIIGVGNPRQDYSNINEDPTPRDFRSVSQQTAVIFNSAMAVASWGDAFGVEGLALAVGLFAPSGYTKHRYPTKGPQRYAIQELDSLIIYPGIGVAYALNRYFQIGAVFLNGMAFLGKAQASRLWPQPEDPDFNEDFGGDATLRLDFNDYAMPTGIVGILSQPLDFLELGVSVRLPVFMNAKGNVKYKAPEFDYPDARVLKGHHNVTVEHHFPWVVTTGARYIHERFDIEVDFIWENWGSYDGMDVDLNLWIDLDNSPDTDPKVVPDTHIPKNFRDTYSVRLGSDIKVVPDLLTVRLGGLWQSSAYPKNNNTFSLDFPFGEQFGASAGLTWHAWGFVDVSIGYLHLFQKQITVTEGIIQQSSGELFHPDPEDPSVALSLGNTVNNGTYDVNLNIISLSAEGHF